MNQTSAFSSQCVKCLKSSIDLMVCYLLVPGCGVAVRMQRPHCAHISSTAAQTRKRLNILLLLKPLCLPGECSSFSFPKCLPGRDHIQVKIVCLQELPPLWTANRAACTQCHLSPCHSHLPGLWLCDAELLLQEVCKSLLPKWTLQGAFPSQGTTLLGRDWQGKRLHLKGSTLKSYFGAFSAVGGEMLPSAMVD